MNRRQLLRTSALAACAATLAACGIVTTTTTNGVTTITVNVTSLDNWGKAIVSASGLIAPMAGPVGATIAAIGVVAEADLAAVDKLTGGSVTLTFDKTSVPSALSSLLADGQKILTNAEGIAPANLTTTAQTYITALETVVNLFAAALGSMAAAAAPAKMTESRGAGRVGGAVSEGRPLAHNRTGDKWDLDEGEFCYVRDDIGRPTYLVFWPWGGRCPIPAAISPHRNGSGATWTLSGTEGAPTLRPSVDAKGIWHGFITDGVARSV